LAPVCSGSSACSLARSVEAAHTVERAAVPAHRAIVAMHDRPVVRALLPHRVVRRSCCSAGARHGFDLVADPTERPSYPNVATGSSTRRRSRQRREQRRAACEKKRILCAWLASKAAKHMPRLSLITTRAPLRQCLRASLSR
jgi:hypothetical protein